jgi:transketolase
MKYDVKKSENLASKGIKIRRNILNTLHFSGGGHFGGSMSVADILLVLFDKILKRGEDKLILSKGHAAAALYSILAEMHYINENSLVEYGKFNSRLEGHPDMLITPGVDFSTGSLGQGLSVGLGMAFGMMESKNNVWVILGDGECQEGQIWEAAMLCARYKICNLHVVIDANGAQECGFKFNSELPQEPIPNLVEKWQAFGWESIEVPGHSYDKLEQGFLKALAVKDKPSVVVARTKKGFGVKLFERDPEKYHCASLSEEEYKTALNDLEGR